MHHLVRISFRHGFRHNGLLHAETWGLAMVGLVFANTEDYIYIMLKVERKYELYIALSFQSCFSTVPSFLLQEDNHQQLRTFQDLSRLTSTRTATMSNFRTSPDAFEKDRDALATRVQLVQQRLLEAGEKADDACYKFIAEELSAISVEMMAFNQSITHIIIALSQQPPAPTCLYLPQRCDIIQRLLSDLSDIVMTRILPNACVGAYVRRISSEIYRLTISQDATLDVNAFEADDFALSCTEDVEEDIESHPMECDISILRLYKTHIKRNLRRLNGPFLFPFPCSCKQCSRRYPSKVEAEKQIAKDNIARRSE